MLSVEGGRGKYDATLALVFIFCLVLYLAADPRFEGGGGSSKLNYDIFRKAYGFLGSYQDKEIEELKKSLKKEKNQVLCDFMNFFFDF